MRDAPIAGLVPEEATERGGDARRAAAIARGAERHHARHHRGRRPAARAPGRAFEVPRVARRAPRLGVCERSAAELGSRGLAHGHRAGAAQPSHVDGVGCDRRAALVQQRALRRRHALAVLEVLHTERHPGQRARVFAACDRRVDRLGGAVRELGVDMDEGVERCVVGVNGGEALVEHLDRLHLARAHRLGRFDDGSHARILPR